MSDTTPTPAATGLRAALIRRGKLKADAAPAAPAPKPAKPAKAKWTPPKTAADKEIFARETGRALAVIEHPSFAGRHKMAIALLRNPRLSAKEIGSLLALGDAAPDQRDAALEDMRAALEEARAMNSGSVAGASTGAAAVWDKAIARTFGGEQAK
jgi:hypothetical protein